MHLRCGGIVDDSVITHLLPSAESDGERIWQIGQHLPKLWSSCFFFSHGRSLKHMVSELFKIIIISLGVVILSVLRPEEHPACKYFAPPAVP